MNDKLDLMSHQLNELHARLDSDGYLSPADQRAFDIYAWLLDGADPPSLDDKD